MSNRRRCGLALRFVSPDVRAHKGSNQDTIICRGHDPSGQWANLPGRRGNRFRSN